MRPLIPRYPIATPPLAITNHPRVTLPAYGVGFKRLEEKLEVANPPIRKNAAWIEDVAAIFSPPKPLPRSRPEKTACNAGNDA